jgi:electron transfer flavoprotein alpha subunit
MIAVVPVRGGALVAGGEEAIAEAGGVAVVVGEQAATAAETLAARAVAGAAEPHSQCRELRVLELGTFRPARWAAALEPEVRESGVVVLPASPDGRDVAPRLAAALGWPLLAGAVRVMPQGAWLLRRQGHQIARLVVDGPFVATLVHGVRTLDVAETAGGVITTTGAAAANGGSEGGVAGPSQGRQRPSVVELDAPANAQGADAELLEVLEADPAVVDLAEAARIFAAGAGIGGPVHLATLQHVAAKLGASVGATRVVTDAGWLEHDRQIGTTGVSVRPRCYVAFGVSGAAQHVGGLGTPRHVISVNLDRSCPMMAMADLALVADAPDVLDVLVRRLQPQVPETTMEPAGA